MGLIVAYQTQELALRAHLPDLLLMAAAAHIKEAQPTKTKRREARNRSTIFRLS
jgi:hypothetical protein